MGGRKLSENHKLGLREGLPTPLRNLQEERPAPLGFGGGQQNNRAGCLYLESEYMDVQCDLKSVPSLQASVLSLENEVIQDLGTFL